MISFIIDSVDFYVSMNGLDGRENFKLIERPKLIHPTPSTSLLTFFDATTAVIATSEWSDIKTSLSSVILTIYLCSSDCWMFILSNSALCQSQLFVEFDFDTNTLLKSTTTNCSQRQKSNLTLTPLWTGLVASVQSLHWFAEDAYCCSLLDRIQLWQRAYVIFVNLEESQFIDNTVVEWPFRSMASDMRTWINCFTILSHLSSLLVCCCCFWFCLVGLKNDI